ncbi:MAG: T9SS type A sorting domain-containing protein [Bacteroidales bacterium]
MKNFFLSALLFLLSATVVAQVTFGNKQLIGDSTVGVSAIYTADLDQDGNEDVISGEENYIRWYKNHGNSTFSSPITIVKRYYFSSSKYIGIADLDGDNDNDVIAASFDYNEISWFENDGSGNFMQEHIIQDSAIHARAICVEDLNADNYPDIITGSDSLLSVFLNNGNGNFSMQQSIRPATLKISAIDIMDVNVDGHPDIVAALYDGNKIVIYENDGNANFGNPIIVADNITSPNHLVISDINSNGQKDILASSWYDSTIVWYESGSTPALFTEHIISNSAIEIHQVRATDLDNDGDQDVLTASYLTREIFWYENDGNGNFGPAIIIDDSIMFPTCINSADLDGDGDQDILLGVSAFNTFDVAASVNIKNNKNIEHKIYWYENKTITGISEREKDQFSVFPNPFKNEITVEGIASAFDYTIMDISGRVILKGQARNGRIIELKNMKPGLYLITIKTAERISTQKILRM